MPLRDHFHEPTLGEAPWEAVHGFWTQALVRQLNTVQLPVRYKAIGQAHRGTQVEIDVAAFEEEQQFAARPSSGNGVAVAVWSPPAPPQTTVTDFPAQDLFEIRVYDERRRRLVATVELVSPGNKDRPESRRAFAVKCASYLQQRVSVIIVDVVTESHFNLYREMMLPVMEAANPAIWTNEVHVYAVAVRPMKEQGAWRLDAWPHELAIGEVLPTLPLWLASDFAVPLLLEETYEETCRVLRIP